MKIMKLAIHDTELNNSEVGLTKPNKGKEKLTAKLPPKAYKQTVKEDTLGS